MMNLAMGAKVSLKSTLITWEYLYIVNRTLCLTISPDVSFLVQNTHLHPTFLRTVGYE